MTACRLGGLGSGGFALGDDGVLADWRGADGPLPDPGLALAIRTRIPGGPPVERLLLRPAVPVAGDPPAAALTLHDRFPDVELACRDQALPLRVSLAGWSPCVPMDAEASGLPVAILELRLANPGRLRVRVEIDVALRGAPAAALRTRDGLHGLHAGGVLVASPAPEAAIERDSMVLRLRTALPPGTEAVLPVWLSWGARPEESLRSLVLDHDRLRRRTAALRDAFDGASIDADTLAGARAELARLRDPALRLRPDGSMQEQDAAIAAIAAFFPYLDHGLRLAELRRGIAARDPAATAQAVERCLSTWRMGASIAWLRGSWPALSEGLHLLAAAARTPATRSGLLAGAELAAAMQDEAVLRLCRGAGPRPVRPPGSDGGLDRLWRLAGADHDAASGSLAFAPRRRGRFGAPWTAQLAWGTIAIDARSATLRVEQGRLWLRRLAVGWADAPRLRAARGGEPLPAACDGGAAVFAEPLQLQAGDELVLARA